MDHEQATQLTAVEKYLLDELSPELREEFEEHFFDCQECALDLRVTARFMDAAKNELRAGVNKIDGRVLGMTPRPASVWSRAATWLALAASLLVIVYQNLVVLPRFQGEIAELKAPEILPSISLVGGNSRGGGVPALTVGAAKPFLMLLDIPTQDRFTSYLCKLYSPAGALVWQVGVSAQAARDTVSIRVPATSSQTGVYTLAVQGTMQGTMQETGDHGQPGAVDLAHYSFTVNGLR